MWKKTVLAFLATISALWGLQTRNFVLVVIDGARYSETFGDPNHTYVPRMYELSQNGTIIDSFYNDGYTYTRRAIPAIWCGAWTEVRDTVDQWGNQTQYTLLPSFFEYYRKQQSMPQDSVYYVLKFIQNLWQMSYHPEYGPSYWPTYHSQGQDDADVFEKAKFIMETLHPRLMMVYFADVDHAGHTGDWNYYTSTIRKADSLVALLWEEIQTEPFYANRTSMIVTNDHGRHDDQHGGFQGHGCGCEGCRHIMFLALGPDFKQGYVSYNRRTIPDIVPTMGYMMGFDPEYSTGSSITEIFSPAGVSEANLRPEPEIGLFPSPARGEVTFFSSTEKFARIDIYSPSGRLVKVLEGPLPLRWDARGLPAGVYFYFTGGGSSGRITLLP